MRRIAMALALTSMVAASTVLAASLVPSVRIVSVAPFKVSGSHFKPHERLTLTASRSGKPLVRVVRASANGDFTAVLGDRQALNVCAGGVTIRVVTANGTVILVKIPPRMCATRQP